MDLYSCCSSNAMREPFVFCNGTRRRNILSLPLGIEQESSCSVSFRLNQLGTEHYVTLLPAIYKQGVYEDPPQCLNISREEKSLCFLSSSLVTTFQKLVVVVLFKLFTNSTPTLLYSTVVYFAKVLLTPLWLGEASNSNIRY